MLAFLNKPRALLQRNAVLRPSPARTVVGGLGNCEVFEARNVLKDVVTSGVQRSMRYLKVLFSSMDAGRGRSAAAS